MKYRLTVPLQRLRCGGGWFLYGTQFRLQLKMNQKATENLPRFISVKTHGHLRIEGSLCVFVCV